MLGFQDIIFNRHANRSPKETTVDWHAIERLCPGLENPTEYIFIVLTI